MKNLIVILLVIIALFLTRPFVLGKININKFASNSTEKYSLIITGYAEKDQDGNWTGEAAPFLKLLQDSSDEKENLGFCEVSYKGKIYGQNVLVVATGMGKVKTSACTSEILERYKGSIKEVIFAGTAGITPMKGGLLDENGKLRHSEAAVLGDICVNSVAFDFDSQYYTSDSKKTNTLKPFFWTDQNDPIEFNTGSDGLVRELLLNSEKVTWPEVDTDLIKYDQLYNPGTKRGPKVWQPSECIEASGDLFWHDIKADIYARRRGAMLLSRKFARELTEKDIVIVTSMESSSISDIVRLWNKNHNDRIPFAYVRAASNFDHVYLTDKNMPLLDASENLNGLEKEKGSLYAIETSTLPVIKMFESRNNK